jgi:hypothetical protein
LDFKAIKRETIAISYNTDNLKYNKLGNRLSTLELEKKTCGLKMDIRKIRVKGKFKTMLIRL